jgi:hypothetical protein
LPGSGGHQVKALPLERRIPVSVLDEERCRSGSISFWLADSGGKGIQVVAVVHGEAQLAERWGTTAARSSWTPPR